MEPNTEAIVRMSWARALGLDDDAFTGAGPRHVVVRDADVVLAVRLGERSALQAPQWAAAESEQYTDEVLLSRRGLLQLTRDHAAKGVRACHLLYADDYVKAPELEEAVITDDPAALEELLARCAPDDVGQADLRSRSHRFVLLDDDERPVAAAAYDDDGGLVADLSLIEAIEVRGRALDALVGAIAVNAALDDGLIPQMLVDVDSSQEISSALGFDKLGQLARVTLGEA